MPSTRELLDAIRTQLDALEDTKNPLVRAELESVSRQLATLGQRANDERTGRPSSSEFAILSEFAEHIPHPGDALPSLVSFVDRELRYVYNNEAYRTWFDAVPRAGTHVSEVLGPENYARARPHLERAFKGEGHPFELALLSIHGGFLPPCPLTR